MMFLKIFFVLTILEHKSFRKLEVLSFILRAGSQEEKSEFLGGLEGGYKFY